MPTFSHFNLKMGSKLLWAWCHWRSSRLTPNFHNSITAEIWSQSGRPSMISENERRISNYFRRHLRSSLKPIEIRLAHPRSSTLQVLRNRLHLFPYRLPIVQELKVRDYEARFEFFIWCIENILFEASFLSCYFCDECVVHVDEKENKHGVAIRGSENPQEEKEVSKDTE